MGVPVYRQATWEHCFSVPSCSHMVLKVEWCKENHMRAVEFSRPGIFAKQEIKDEYGGGLVASTSRGVMKPERNEYVEDFKKGGW